MLFILISIVQFNAFVNMVTFMPKYLEQHYGKSSSDAIFLMGMFILLYIGSPLFFFLNHERVNSVLMMGLANS